MSLCTPDRSKNCGKGVVYQAMCAISQIKGYFTSKQEVAFYDPNGLKHVVSLCPRFCAKQGCNLAECVCKNRDFVLISKRIEGIV